MDTVGHTSLLEEHGIKPTANRLLIVKALGAQRHPVSVKDLEDSLLTLDKSSIFRVLTLFREHHLVHAIETGEGIVKYELCLSHSEAEDDDEHVHFYCERCHRTICLHDIPVPQIPVPKGYRAEGTNVLVRGICDRCLKL
jgi:Fur family ferric uptake transcriptional regulator